MMYKTLLAIIIFLFSATQALAQDKMPANTQFNQSQAYKDIVKNYQNTSILSTEELLDDDTLLNVLLMTPENKRQYVFPQIHEETFLSHKVKSHPEIIIWKNKKPTVITPHLQAFSEKYLDKLHPALYPLLDPDFWALPSEERDQFITKLEDNPLVLPQDKTTDYVYPSLSDIFKFNDKKDLTTPLKKEDIQHFTTVLLGLNYFMDHHPDAPNPQRLMVPAFSGLSGQKLSHPFQTYYYLLHQTGLAEDVEKFVKEAGFENLEEFAYKGDKIIRAYRALRLPLALAIQLNHIRTETEPYSFDPNNEPTQLQALTKMYESTAGDIHFAKQNEALLEPLLRKREIIGYGLMIYVD